MTRKEAPNKLFLAGKRMVYLKMALFVSIALQCPVPSRSESVACVFCILATLMNFKEDCKMLVRHANGHSLHSFIPYEPALA